MTYTNLVNRNLTQVRDRIAEAALRSGRDPGRVTLVAVSKTFPAAAVVAGYEMGLRDFGENRPEEGAVKIPQVAALLGEQRPTWHMVGHVQSRKAALTVDHFDVVHSVDRLKIAHRLSQHAQERERALSILVECNVSGEPAKHGFAVDRWQEDEDQRAAFFAACAEIIALPGVLVRGLMTIAPLVDDPQEARPTFAGLRGLRDALVERFPGAGWQELSMGMTDDYEVAIEEGATIVRIGRALFGARRSADMDH